MNTIKIKKSLLTPPGVTIQENINHIGMSQAELAERLGRSIPKLNELIKGKASLTKETVLKLEYVLGIPASFWLNKEKIYQEQLLEIEKLELLENSSSWLTGFPLKKLKDLNILPETSNKIELADNLLKFFRVASPKEWSSIYEQHTLTFKLDPKQKANPKAISTWLRLGEIQAEKVKLEEFNKKKLTLSLPQIQQITGKSTANSKNRLQNLCSSFGVALVYSPSIENAPVLGAARWIKNKTIPLIQLTDTKNDFQALWFNFYHELAHIRYHNKSEIFIDGINNSTPDEEKEREADEFAKRMLFNKF